LISEINILQDGDSDDETIYLSGLICRMMNPNISTTTCYKIKNSDEMNSEYKHIFDRDHKQQQQHQMQVVSQHSSFVVVAIVAIHDAFVVAFAVHYIVPTVVIVVAIVADDVSGCGCCCCCCYCFCYSRCC
jgi:hypothetical protein